MSTESRGDAAGMHSIRQYVDTDMQIAVVQAISDALDIDPMTLPPMYDVLPMDAIESFPTTGDGSHHICMSFRHLTIRVWDDGAVTCTSVGPA